MTGLKRGLVAAAVTLLAAGGATALAGDNDAGFKTSHPSMLDIVVATPRPPVPIITVGDTLPSGYRFEAIPDGISLHARGRGRVDLFVNHETSTVPFPFSTAASPLPAPEANQNDFDNSQVSLLSLNQHSAGVLQGRLAITSSENFQRFCSNYLATEKEGFDRPIFFTNEEAQDVVRRSGTAWEPLAIGLNTPGAEQPGVVVAYDVRNGKHKPIYGMGRHDHENSMAVPHPGSGKLVVLSGDDSFVTAPVTSPPGPAGYPVAWSQVYAYMADSTDELWNDEGDLWAFVSDTPGYDDYYDFDPTVAPVSITGHFVKVPKKVATGKKADGTELTSADFPGMLPPPTGAGVPSGVPPDGPQWVLDQWGTAANNEYGENVFRFVRIEDTAYDKRPGMENVIYLADSGRAQTGNPQKGRSTNGRIWKMVLNKDDPTVVDSLSIFVEGDNGVVAASDAAGGALGEIHQPDNVETTANGSLLVQEDPSSNNTYAQPAASNKTNARIWQVFLGNADPDGTKRVVATVNQSADEQQGDVDGVDPAVFAPGRIGAWESSGIVDASAVFGAGTFLVTIQAHTLWIEKADGPDTAVVPASPDYVNKREGGQLILITIPGA